MFSCSMYGRTIVAHEWTMYPVLLPPVESHWPDAGSTLYADS